MGIFTLNQIFTSCIFLFCYNFNQIFIILLLSFSIVLYFKYNINAIDILVFNMDEITYLKDK